MRRDTRAHSTLARRRRRRSWFNHLQPGVVKGPWTKEEDTIIFSMHAEVGNAWKAITRMLPGRTDNQVKNRFYSAQRRVSRVEYQENSLPGAPRYAPGAGERAPGSSVQRPSVEAVLAVLYPAGSGAPGASGAGAAAAFAAAGGGTDVCNDDEVDGGVDGGGGDGGGGGVVGRGVDGGADTVAGTGVAMPPSTLPSAAEEAQRQAAAIRAAAEAAARRDAAAVERRAAVRTATADHAARASAGWRQLAEAEDYARFQQAMAAQQQHYQQQVMMFHAQQQQAMVASRQAQLLQMQAVQQQSAAMAAAADIRSNIRTVPQVHLYGAAHGPGGVREVLVLDLRAAAAVGVHAVDGAAGGGGAGAGGARLALAPPFGGSAGSMIPPHFGAGAHSRPLIIAHLGGGMAWGGSGGGGGGGLLGHNPFGAPGDGGESSAAELLRWAPPAGPGAFTAKEDPGTVVERTC